MLMSCSWVSLQSSKLKLRLANLRNGAKEILARTHTQEGGNPNRVVAFDIGSYEPRKSFGKARGYPRRHRV